MNYQKVGGLAIPNDQTPRGSAKRSSAPHRDEAMTELGPTGLRSLLQVLAFDFARSTTMVTSNRTNRTETIMSSAFRRLARSTADVGRCAVPPSTFTMRDGSTST